MGHTIWTRSKAITTGTRDFECFVSEDDAPTGQRLPAIVLGATEDQCARRANLVSAAPDMLEALKRCIAALSANGAPNCEAVKEARAAIARAEGK